MLARYRDAIRREDWVWRVGHVRKAAGLSIEAEGPDARLGEICEIHHRDGNGHFLAEVIGVLPQRTILMPYSEMHGVGTGCEVVATGNMPEVAVGSGLLGRVIDAFGHPLDGLPLPAGLSGRPLRSAPLNPLSRPRIDTVMETGVRAIDAFLTLGRGQRVGIFAGSGVGKSTLLGMIARHVKADVNVIALIGERGREVREFIEKQLGKEGLARSVVVVATSDQPALARSRAAYAATAIAEYFRDQGQHVLLTMDSVTRFAMARREIGLSAGEPPTARGYTPSVFAELPELCERCGTASSGGSITALYTVLVEGDDFNEPIADILRATLDGHFVLTRQLAHAGHYPALDILQSSSRLLTDLTSPAEQALLRQAVSLMATYESNRQMIEMGAYQSGSHAEIERAIQLAPKLKRFLQQKVDEVASRKQVLMQLQSLSHSG